MLKASTHVNTVNRRRRIQHIPPNTALQYISFRCCSTNKIFNVQSHWNICENLSGLGCQIVKVQILLLLLFLSKVEHFQWLYDHVSRQNSTVAECLLIIDCYAFRCRYLLLFLLSF